jgi:hypothetical protein
MSFAPAVLLVSLAVSAPALWASLVDQTMPVDVALQRFVVILVVLGVGGSALRALFGTYTRTPTVPTGTLVGGEPDRRRPTGVGAENPAPPVQ